MTAPHPLQNETDPSLPQVPGFAAEGLVAQYGLRSVYRARRQATGEVVALHVIPWGDGPDDTPRSRAGALQARLSHPHVERLFAEGWHGGSRYLVTEYLDSDLQARLRDGPVPPQETAALLASVARAVHYLHGRGVLHRNLKPRNVLFAADGSPRVGGFSLAIDKVDRDTPPHGGAVVGTPAYMAPEQAAGHSWLSPAADTYSLGVILYECLTGRQPFSGATAMDTLMAVINEPPPEPPEMVPELLRTACRRCLRKAPGERYPTAQTLAEDLERFLASPA